MNRDPIALFLAVLLIVCSAGTAALCYWYLQCTRQVQQAQADVARINQNRALIQSLLSESLEYSKKNPSILPVLEKLGWRGRETNSPGSHP